MIVLDNIKMKLTFQLMLYCNIVLYMHTWYWAPRSNPQVHVLRGWNAGIGLGFVTDSPLLKNAPLKKSTDWKFRKKLTGPTPQMV